MGTANLNLSYLVASQAQKEVTHNDALNDLDYLAQASVLDWTLTTPPASPVEGAVYIVGASPTGAWGGKAGCLAAYYGGWRFKTPVAGWRVWVRSESKYVYYTGTAWAVLAVPYSDTTWSWTPGVLAANAGASATVAVSGAAFGNFVSVAAPYDLQGVWATGYVSSAGTVVVRVVNLTAASVTLGAGSWRVRVSKN